MASRIGRWIALGVVALVAPSLALAQNAGASELTSRGRDMLMPPPPKAGLDSRRAACGDGYPNPVAHDAAGFSVLAAWWWEDCGVVEYRPINRFVLRLTDTGKGNVEAMRNAAVRAATQVESVSGIEVRVALGTIPDRAPMPGEILLSVNDTAACREPWAGCAGPSNASWSHDSRHVISASGSIQIKPGETTLPPTIENQHNWDHLVAHELGHALGLAHHDASFNGETQVMHWSSYDAKAYRAGDRNGFGHLGSPPPAPSVSVAAPTSITTSSATLNGSVNPNGWRARYRFEYGTTSAYGNAVPIPDAGTGTGAGAVQQTLSGLLANTTYHYRLVATNAGGTVASADATFTTALVPRPAPVELPGGTVYMFYRGANDQLRAWLWDGSNWSNPGWGGAGAMAGDPAAVVTTEGIAEVYFRTASGQMGRWRIRPGFFQPDVYGVANVTGNPSAVADRDGGAQVFYRMSSGQLGRWWFNGASWNWTDWGYATVGGSPAAVLDSDGTFEALYRTSTNTTGRWRFPGNGYQDLSYGAADVTGDPAAAITNGTYVNVFYRMSSGQLGRWWFNGASWNWTGWGYATVAGNPTVVATQDDQLEVLYRTTDRRLGRFWFSGDDWNDSSAGVPGEIAGDPAALIDARGNAQVFFGGPDGRYRRYSYEPRGAGWNWESIG